MTAEQGGHPEAVFEAKDAIRRALLQDNQSEIARNKVNIWYFNYESGKMYLKRGCCDSRPLSDDEFVSEEDSISSGFPHKEDFGRKYNDPRFIAIVNESHFAQFRIGQRPQNCGGQDTKARIRQGQIIPDEELTEYVNNNVHEDPIVQSLLQARETAYYLGTSGKIFVVTQDHESGVIYPVGEYILSNGLEKRQIPLEFRRVLEARGEKELERAYDPAVIYVNGIPQLLRTELSPEFQNYLEIARKKMLSINLQYPNLKGMQAVQNPTFLAISTNKIPLHVRYPGIFGRPGSVFKFHIPQNKSEQIITIQQKWINEAIANIKYAIEHALKNFGKPNLPFVDSKVMFIETGSLEESEKIATQLRSKEWMQKWLELDGHFILIGETKGGTTIRIKAL